MAYLFDTDALSEVMRPRGRKNYLRRVSDIPREEQFTSAVVIGELYKGAFRSSNPPKYVDFIESEILVNLTTLPYDTASAKVFGQLRSQLEIIGRVIEDSDLQIAATAVHHGLELVTGNIKHFERVPGLKLNRMLADS